MQYRIAELRQLCEERGLDITVKPSLSNKRGNDHKWLRRDYALLLRRDALSRRVKSGVNTSWGMSARCGFYSPMLAFSGFPKLSEKDQKELVDGDRWVYEPKIDGLRVIVCYHPREGFTLFGRSTTSEFLPEEFTGEILWLQKGIPKSDSELRGIYDTPLVLDAELLLPNIEHYASVPPISAGRRISATEYVMSSYKGDGLQDLQIQTPPRFYVFDILRHGGTDMTGSALFNRRVLLKRFFNEFLVNLDAFKLSPMYSPTLNDSPDALGFHEKWKSSGGEGVVFKNLDSKYMTQEQRSRKTWVKWRW